MDYVGRKRGKPKLKSIKILWDPEFMGEEGKGDKKDSRSEIPEVPQWLFLLIGVLVVVFYLNV